MSTFATRISAAGRPYHRPGPICDLPGRPACVVGAGLRSSALVGRVLRCAAANSLVFLRAPWRWRTACRLGPPVLWRRRTFDRRIERCAPAVPQHDRARTSAIPLPAHRPCAAASQQSPAAIVPHGVVGCLVGFRQEGSTPSTPYMRCLIKWGNSFASFAQKVHNPCQPRRSSGGKLKCPRSSLRSSFQSGSSRMSA